MSLLFRRKWRLQVVPPLQSIVQTSRYAMVFASELGATPLRLQFECERSLMSEPNKGKISITNLKKSVPATIRPGTLVFLEAGYADNLALIYKGEVANVATVRDGAETNTTLECGDGEPYIAYSHVNLSYKGTVTLAQVLQDIAAQMRVTIGGQVFSRKGLIVQGLPNKKFNNLCLTGLLRDALDGLLIPFGLSWSIQSGVLIIQNKKGLLKFRASVINSSSGLIGNVSRTETGVQFSTLMIPEIVPGNAVAVQGQGRDLNGNYRVVKATYKGDTMGQEWGIDVQAQQLTHSIVPIPTTQQDKNLNAAVDASADADADEGDEVLQ